MKEYDNRQVMYIGPSINGIVKNSAVFFGIPERVKKLSDTLPQINRLLIPVDRITAGIKAVREQGTVENLAYKKVLNYIEGGTTDVNL